MTDNATITFSPAALDGVAGELAAVLDALTSSVERLHADVERARASWQGAAQEAFAVLMEEWKKAEADLRAQQERLHGAVITSRAAYVSAHASVRRTWGAA